MVFLIKPKSAKSIYNALKKFNNLTFKNKTKFEKKFEVFSQKNRFDEKFVVSQYLNQIKNNEIN